MKNYLLVFSFIAAFCFSSFGQPFGKAIVFGGASSYVEVPAHDSLHGSSALTLEAWVKPCADVGREMVFSKVWCNGNQNSYYLDIWDGKLRWIWFSANCGSSTGTNRYISDSAVIQANTWQHIAVVHSASQVKLFLNGVEIAASLTSGSYGNLRPSNTPLILGGYKALSGSMAFLYEGQIDEVRIWNDTLSDSEILSRYNTPLLGNETHLMGYYPFDEPTVGPGQIVKNEGAVLDSLGNGETKGSINYQAPFYVDAHTAYLLPEDTVYCANDVISHFLNVNVPNGSYLWENGDTNYSRQISTAGDFHVTISNSCYSVQDTFSVFQLVPLNVNLGGDTNLCGMSSYTLDASSPFSNYLWSTGSTDSMLTVNYSGLYAVTVTNSCEQDIDSIWLNGLLYVDSTSGCDSVLSPSGNTWWNTNGVYYDTITYMGCDSIIEIHVGLTHSSFATLSEVVCDSFVSYSGQHTWYTSGQYFDTLVNQTGCDSIITVNLTVKGANHIAINELACDSYTAPDGQVYTTSGVYSAVMTNSMGCDSIITINLTVNSSTSSSITTTSCGPYTAPDGAIYAVTGNYTAVIPNSNGCDSTIAIDVTVTDIDTSLTLNGNELEAVNDSSYNYQWVDCDLNLAIPGETNSLMTVTESGNYKVIISTSNCVDTSGCANVIVANTLELNNYNIRLYPNPAKQFVTLSGDLTQVKVDVFDLNGKRVHTGIKQSERYTVPVANWPRGMYLFRTTYRGTVQTAKISLE